MNMIIVGKDCEKCSFGTIEDTNKARVKVYCTQREKWYWYGTCIPCENKLREDIKENINEDK